MKNVNKPTKVNSNYKGWQRLLWMGMVAIMLIGVPVTAFADLFISQNDPCENHLAHDAVCGYVEAQTASPCMHEHGSECYVEQDTCAHVHGDECYIEGMLSCAHVHDFSCTYSELNCTHSHSSDCGYAEEVVGHDCEHKCEKCDPVGDLDPNTGVFDKNTLGDLHTDVIFNFDIGSDKLTKIEKRIYNDDGTPLFDEYNNPVRLPLAEYTDELMSGDYTVSADGQIVTLLTAYMANLAEQDHVFYLTFKSGLEKEFVLTVNDTTEAILPNYNFGEVPELGDMPAIMAYAGPMMLNFAPQNGSIDQGLVAEFIGVTTSNRTGGIGQMRLYSSLASTDANAYATVRIEVPTTPSGMTLPQFASSNTYTVATADGRVVTISLVTSGDKQYLEYQIFPGETLTALIHVSVPNGTSPNGTTVTFAEPFIHDSSGLGTNNEFLGGSLTFNATFEWNSVVKRVSPTSTRVVLSGSNFVLADDLVYTITASNINAGATSGVIFTKDYTLTDNITLPTGLTFPTGTTLLTNGNKTITIDGTTVATLSQAATSVTRVSDTQLRIVYTVTNSGVPTADLPNLDLVVTLKGGTLIANISTLDTTNSNNNLVTNKAAFNATPYCPATVHNSDATVTTSVTVPEASFTITKMNSPSSSTRITSTNTEIIYTIRVVNTSITSQVVTVKDTVPANTVFVTGSATPSGATVTGGVVTWANVTLAAGESKDFIFKVKVAEGTASPTTITNSATLEYGTGKTMNSNNVTNIYDTSDDISIKKTHSAGSSVSDGGVIPYQIVVTNLNTERGCAANTVIDQLQSGVELTDAQLAALVASYPGTTYVKATGVITIPIGALPASGYHTINFEATLVGTFTNNQLISNTARIESPSVSSTTTVLFKAKTANVTLIKDFSNLTQIAVDRWEARFAITVTNIGDADTSGLASPLYFEDVMSGGMRPKGAGSATSGTLAGLDSKGNTVTGNWTRTIDNDGGYVYTVIWPDIPVLQPGESYSIYYDTDIYAQQREDGSYMPLNASNTVIIPLYHGGTGVVIQAELLMEKNITNHNGDTGSWKQTTLYAGDYVHYTISITNTTNVAVLSGPILTDTLPVIKAGSSFAWVMGSTVVTSEPAGIAKATLSNGVLTWNQIAVPANSTVNIGVRLYYPASELLTSAFGPRGTVIQNSARLLYRADDIRDSVTHIIDEVNLNAVKSADKTSLDISSGDEADKTVVFTLSDFDAPRTVQNMSVTDDLSDLNGKFTISTINYGNFSVYNASNGLMPYIITLTYANGTTTDYTITNNVTTSVPKTGDIIGIQWNFGTVSKVVINTAPTITAVANDNITGTVRNVMYVAYNDATVAADAKVHIQNTATLSKTLYDAAGREVTSGENSTNRVAGDSMYHYEIKFTNTTGASLDLSTLTFVDVWNRNGVRTTSPVISPITAKHFNAYGGVVSGANAAVVGSYSWVATGTGQYYKATIPVSGVMAPGDVLVLTYTFKTDKVSNIASGSTVASILDNTMTVTFANDDNLVAACGPFSVKRNLNFSAQKTVVGTAYGKRADEAAAGTYSGDPDGTYAYVPLYNGDASAAWANTGNDNYTLSTMPDDGSDTRYVIYDITLVVTPDSYGRLVINSATLFNDHFFVDTVASGGYLRFVGVVESVKNGGVHDMGVVSEGNKRLLRVVKKTTSTSYANFPSIVTDDLGNTYSPATFPEFGGSHLFMNITSSNNGVAFGSSGFNAEYYVHPGESVTFRIVLAEDIHHTATLGWLNTASWKVAEDWQWKDPTNNNVNNYASGLFSYVDRKLEVPTYANTLTPLNSNIPGNSLDTSMGTTNLTATATIEYAEVDVGITKEAIAYRTKASNFVTEIPLTGTNAPGLEDQIVWKITVTNHSEFENISTYYVTDQMPFPYTYVLGSLKYDDGATSGLTQVPEAMTLANLQRDPVYCDGQALISLTLYNQYNGYKDKMFYYSSPVGTGGGTGERLTDIIGFWVTPFGLLRDDGTYYTDGVLEPGESISFTYAMEPKDVYKNVIPVAYTTYTNSAGVIIPRETVNVVEGTEIVAVQNYYTTNRAVGDVFGARNYADVSLGGSFVSTSDKLVTNTAEVTASAKGSPNKVGIGSDETFTYTLEFKNVGAAGYSNLVIIDRLPMLDDRGVVNMQSVRGSEFAVNLPANTEVSVQSSPNGTTWTDVVGATVTYNTVAYSYSFGSTTDWAGAGTGWSSESSGKNTIRVVFPSSFSLEKNATVRVTFKAKVATPGSVKAGQIGWNSFGYSYEASDQGVIKRLYAEAPKVGVEISGAKITINKKVNQAGTALQGAVFGIYTSPACTAATLVETITTNSSGIAISSLLAKRVYYVKETVAPDGYVPPGTVYTVDLTNVADNASFRVNNSNIVNITAPITVGVTKSFANGVTPPASNQTITITMEGVFFGYTQSTKRNVTFTSSEWNGSTVKYFDNIIAGNTYTITEGSNDYVFTATGTYGAGGTFTVTNGVFTPEKDGTIAVVNNNPSPGRLRVKKVVNGTAGSDLFTIEVKGVFSDSNGATVARTYTFGTGGNANIGVFLTIPNVMYGKTYTITEVVGGAKYDVEYSDTAVLMQTTNIDVTVTNTPKTPGKLTLQKLVDGATPTTNVGSFTVRVTGSFSDTVATYKDITLSYSANSALRYKADVSGVKFGETYIIAEIGLDNAIYENVVYTGLGVGGALKLDSDDVIITVNNIKIDTSKVPFTLTKQVEANSLNTARTFTFTIKGTFNGVANTTYTGTVTTSSSGTVLWNVGGTYTPTLMLEAGKSYTLTEVAMTGNTADYEFVKWSTSISGGTATNSTANPLSINAVAGQTSIAVTATNAVKKAGSVKVKKVLRDSNNALITVKPTETIYIALYKSGENTPYKVEELTWNTSSHQYNDVEFTNVPYGRYDVYEVLKVGPNYVKASLSSNNFPYTVTGEGAVEINHANYTSGMTLTTITNKQRAAETAINLTKTFAGTADREILADKTFTVKIFRKDGGVIVGSQTEILLTLQGTSWTNSASANLRMGDYIAYEVPSSDGTWQNTSISGNISGTVVNSKTSPTISGIPAGTPYVEFTVSDVHAITGLSLALTFNNKATSKLLNSFTVNKITDSVAGLTEAGRTFTFQLFKRVSGTDVLVATATMVKNGNNSQAVTSWVAAGGGAWNPDTYLWEIGATYKVIEAAHNLFTLDSVTGGTAITGGASFVISADVNSYSFTFSNVRNHVTNVGLLKAVIDSGGENVATQDWPDGTRFVFGIYDKMTIGGNDVMVQIGTIIRTAAQPNGYITTSQPLYASNTYYIRELSWTPESRYEFVSIIDSSLSQTLGTEVYGGETYYSFVANGMVVLKATNELKVPMDYALKITKNLVDSANNPYVATEDEDFVFEITGPSGNKFFHIVTVRKGSSTATITINELDAGTYTVKELSNNWRFTLTSANNVSATLTNPDVPASCSFTNRYINDHWVSDKTSVTNYMPEL